MRSKEDKKNVSNNEVLIRKNSILYIRIYSLRNMDNENVKILERGSRWERVTDYKK